jgi:transcriptional regulator
MLTEQEWKVLLLRKTGLNQYEMAAELGISQSAISRFETNARNKLLSASSDLALMSELGLTIPRPSRDTERLSTYQALLHAQRQTPPIAGQNRRKDRP